MGEDRVGAQKAVKTALGADYEVFEGENLSVNDLPSIFLGTSLFGSGKRRILLKDVAENSAVWEKIPDYLETEHDIVLWETKADKRSAVYKALKAAGVEIREFAEKANFDPRAVFGILDLARRDGKKAVEALEKIELQQDPYMFVGLMVSQELRRFAERPTASEKRILKMLAEIDMQMKTTSVEPWLIVKSFLLRVAGN